MSMFYFIHVLLTFCTLNGKVLTFDSRCESRNFGTQWQSTVLSINGGWKVGLCKLSEFEIETKTVTK